jgi:CRISPR-associated endoribonuclease Cas6
MDLISLVLHLRPSRAPAPETLLPPWWGRAAHALLLEVVRQVDDPLANDLHMNTQAEANNLVRPFTVSSLTGRFVQGVLDPAEIYSLRLTAFRPDVAELLATAACSGVLRPGRTVELDYIPFEVVSVQPALPGSQEVSQGKQSSEAVPVPARGWAAFSTYQELSAPFLLAKQPAPRRVSLQFNSPTTFKSGGRHVPIPTPELVFGSLLERWNAYAPISFPAEVKRYASECLAVSKYVLETRPVPMKSGGLRVGAVGRISYATLNYDRYWMSVIATLAAFSLYAGVGAGTSTGLGQTRATYD